MNTYASFETSPCTILDVVHNEKQNFGRHGIEAAEQVEAMTVPPYGHVGVTVGDATRMLRVTGPGGDLPFSATPMSTTHSFEVRPYPPSVILLSSHSSITRAAEPSVMGPRRARARPLRLEICGMAR